MIELINFIKLVAAILVLVAAGFGVGTAYNRFITSRKKRKIAEDESASSFVGQFNDDEIKDAVAGYIVPHCSPSDPANREGEEFLADTRESIFSFFDRNVESAKRSYNLLLSDTGMGKTSFCINYFVHLKNKYPHMGTCLISLSSPDSLTHLDKIKNKSQSILIADALDEDIESTGRGRDRLSDVLSAASDFQMVIITCRSQYFMADDAIPRETPLPVLIPRALGQTQNFSLVRSYISPFDKKEINRYISKHFPFWQPWKIPSRLRAVKLAEEIPDLAYRPMLLDRLPELVRENTNSDELYDLYDFMVEGWLKRESRWIDTDRLRQISDELALYIYSRMPGNRGRISHDEIQYVAKNHSGSDPDWKHLSARSLLNRDSQGQFKFVHKSILEFLLVRLAVLGDDRPLDYPWTPFMKELFISWGHSKDGRHKWKRAQKMLERDIGKGHVAPLYDSWAAPASSGFPDFKRITSRRFTQTNSRLAPSAWRSASISVDKAGAEKGWSIDDREFNLKWLLVNNNAFKRQKIDEKLIDILKLSQINYNYALPSYDQFVALIEGLSCIKSNLIKDRDFYLLSDKPAKREHLLVCLGEFQNQTHFMKVIDKDRRIAGTNRVISACLTGIGYNPEFANKIKVRQLWLLNDAIEEPILI